jgi:ubiquinone biosynthesis protein
VSDGAALVQRLPRLAANAEAALAMIAQGGVKLHPDTMAALAKTSGGGRGRGGGLPWAWVAVLAVAVAVLA